jgi:hypothetical protein
MRKRFLELEFSRVILSFLLDNPKVNSEAMQMRLGREMNEFGVNLAGIGVATMGRTGTMMKPFNKAVLPAIWDVMKDLSLIEKDRNNIELMGLDTNEKEQILQERYDYFIWTNQRERLIFASLLDILERQDAVKIICPYLDIKVFEILNNLKLLRGKIFEIITRIEERHGSHIW